MTAITVRRRFRLSRFEIFLGLAVLAGLFYIYYAYGLSDKGANPAADGQFNRAAQEGVAGVIHSQAGINKSLAELSVRLDKLTETNDSAEAAAINKQLIRLNETLEMLESRLGEIARLLPRERPETTAGD